MRGRLRGRPATRVAATQRVDLEVNGRRIVQETTVDATLLAVLRGDGLTGAKEACGRGECGACTVLVDDAPRLSCVALASQVRGSVTTIEGLAEGIADLREAFADCAGFQCAYCTPGHLVTAWAVLESWDAPDREEIRHRISGNLCRCTGYSQIVDAIQAVAQRRGLDSSAS